MRNSPTVGVPMVLGLLAVSALFVLMAVDYGDAPGLGAWQFAAGFALLAVATAWICLPARGEVSPGASEVRGSLPLAAMVALAVLLGIGGVLTWSVVLLSETGAGGFRVGGFFLVMVVGAAGALGAVWRVATGRSHVPRIEFDDAGLHYRGGRTTRSMAWDEIGSIALADRHRRLVVRSKRDDGEPLRIPTLAFDVAPTRILAVVEHARSTHARRDLRPRRER